LDSFPLVLSSSTSRSCAFCFVKETQHTTVVCSSPWKSSPYVCFIAFYGFLGRTTNHTLFEYGAIRNPRTSLQPRGTPNLQVLPFLFCFSLRDFFLPHVVILCFFSLLPAFSILGRWAWGICVLFGSPESTIAHSPPPFRIFLSHNSWITYSY